MEENDFRKWYEEHQKSHEALGRVTIGILTDLLKQRGIDYLSVAGRTKSLESAIDKSVRKGMSDPTTQIQDFCGVRVVTFVEKDILQVARLIKECFHVHPEESADKSVELGTDRMGYRSIHFICDLGEERLELEEFNSYKNLVLEIQVRTVLQHAWAEIGHDRSYKFSGILPQELERKLNLAAGLLEVADGLLDTLAQQIDRYSLSVSRRGHDGDLNIEVNSITLYQYLTERAGKMGWPFLRATISAEEKNLLMREAQDFGLKTIRDLDQLVTEQFLKACEKRGKSPTTPLGLLRLILMFNDIEKFLITTWGRRWSNMQLVTYKILIQKYDRLKLNESLRKRGITPMITFWE